MARLWNAFALDYRSIRLFRVLLGVGLIGESFDLFPAISDFMTDDGIYPRLYLTLYSQIPLLQSPMNLFGGYWWAALWVASLAVFGLLLIFNIRPRLASLLSFLALQAIFTRADLIMFGVDELARAVCFWSIFLPAGKESEDKKLLFSGGSIAVILQIIVLYVAAGFAKSRAVWWDEPIASYIALQGDVYATAFGRWMGQFTDFLALSTRFVWLLERAGWIMILVWWRKGLMRFVAFGLFAGMHVMFGLCMHLGLFPYFDVVILSLLLPPWFWDQFELSRIFEPAVEGPAQSPLAKFWSLLAEPVPIVAAGLIAWSALASLPETPVFMAKGMARGMNAVGLGQRWNLFAPEPFRDDGWYVTVGYTYDGQEVDPLALKEAAPSFAKPEDFHLRNPNGRWTQFFTSLMYQSFGLDADHFSGYLCERWQRSKLQPLKEVQVYFMSEPSLPPGQVPKVNQMLQSYRPCPGAPPLGKPRVPLHSLANR